MTANRTAPFFSRMVSASDEPDADLVRRYASARDAAAFESLVRRHGPLVLAICRRTLGREHDAEDAFQAAFLVLAQKAGRIREPQLLSAWLYGVAVRVANKAKSRAARRREEARAEVPEPFANDPAAVSDIGPLLDAELAALPEWYRQAVLLCDVQELSRSEAAARLGIPEGTLSSRLAVGRKRLAARLARRGVVLSAPAMASVATAAVPEKLIQQAIETATAWAAGGPVANPITELTREGMTMLRKVMMLGCGAATVSIFGLGLAGDPANPPPKPDAKPVLAAGLAEVAKPEIALGPPRQRGILEVPRGLEEIRWSIDGRRIALTGHDQRIPVTQFGTVHSAVNVIDIQETGIRSLGASQPIKGYLVAFHPKDSSALLVHLEESGGINVQNKLIVLNFTTGKPLGESELNESAHVQPTLSPNGRTVLFTTGDDATGETVVREIDFATGKVERTLFRTKDNLSVLSADGSRAVTTRHITRKAKVEAGGGGPAIEQEVNHLHDLTVWDTAANRKLWTWTPDEKFDISEVSATLSRDAKTLAVATSAAVRILDAVSGRELRKYAAAEKRGISEAFLSHDGRLTVLPEYRIPQPVPAGAGGGDTGGGGSPGGLSYPQPPERKTYYVTIFDNATGRALKKWETQLTLGMAFAPDRPTLAILERPSQAQAGAGPGMMGGAGMAGGSGGGQARLGLWEFPTVAK